MRRIVFESAQKFIHMLYQRAFLRSFISPLRGSVVLFKINYNNIIPSGLMHTDLKPERLTLL